VPLHEMAAILAAVTLALFVLFQISLAAGLPLARFVWGGQHDGVLPSRLRAASLIAVPILGLAAWLILAGADLIAPGPEVSVVRIGVWVFSAYFGLNTVMNLASRSKSERLVMTPASLLLVGCFVVVALS